MRYEILIFDDDPGSGQLTLSLLEEQGYSAKLFPDGHNAVEMVREANPRLVILDIMMPGIDGLTLCRILKSTPATKHVIVIIVSGKTYEAERQRAVRSGADLFLGKPFKTSTLTKEIARLVGAPYKKFISLSPPETSSPVTVTTWGSFGSPRGKSEKLTTCVSVHSPVGDFVLDTGTGINTLVQELLKRNKPGPLWVLLTHYHADHISGLQTLSPLLQAGYDLHIGGPWNPEYPLDQIVSRSFVVPGTDSWKAHVKTYSFLEETYSLNPRVRLQALHANHPGPTLCFSLEVLGRKIIYCPANEIPPFSDTASLDFREKFVRFCLGADILIHNAQYTYEEYQTCKGEGGSSFEAAAVMASKAGIKKLVLLHASPAYDSQRINSIIDRARGIARECRMNWECYAAHEGLTIRV